MAREATYGVVRGRAVHAQTTHYLPAMLRIGPKQIKEDLQAADSFNAKVAVLLTRLVGTMWAFWVFNGIALVSLPSAIRSGSLTVLINWVSSNWIQLILLPALMVGQNLQNVAADARAAKVFEDIETVKSDMVIALDQLNTKTEGGLRTVLDAIDQLASKVK